MSDRAEQARAEAEKRWPVTKWDELKPQRGKRATFEQGVEWADANHPAVEALARVRELHRPVDVEPSETICHECSTLRGTGENKRYFPYEEWPCATYQAAEVEDE